MEEDCEECGCAFGQEDDAEVAKWYRKAAEQGNVVGMYNFALRYANGRGVGKDETEAVKWFRKAAEQGDFDAQVRLSKMYENGQGIPEDRVKASQWYRIAKCVQHAQNGNANAQYHLGWHFEEGRLVTRDFTKACGGLGRQRNRDTPTLRTALVRCISRAAAFPRTTPGAVHWYRKAAEQGNSDGQAKLGFMYANGRGVMRDFGQAVEWYRKAADQGNETAKKNLKELLRRMQR